jgi:EAL domain-containing protein (putative c-di-GMP-specific phosphodiesterase class I)
MVPPDVFIPVCRSTGLICTLGAFIFSTADRQQLAWQKAGHDLQVSVNPSARQRREAGLMPGLVGARRAAGADPRSMQL